MLLERDLVEAGFVEAEDMKAALERQRAMGEPLTQSLLMSNAISYAALDNALGYNIPTLQSAKDTGIDPVFLMNLMLKIMLVLGLETLPQIEAAIKLPYKVVEELMTMARDRALVESLGTGERSLIADVRYGLSKAGTDTVTGLLRQSEYAGPAPVTLEAFESQVARQGIENEHVSRERLDQCLAHLVVEDGMIDQFGPGINSGQSILVYGPVGNGKTSMALALANAFENYVYIPHSLVVDGQIISVFDPTVHEEMQITEELPEQAQGQKRIFKSAEDRRWVRCKRPTVISGGELTMEMLDLKFDAQLRISEAPLQLKAVSGIFIIDDFGRQAVRPEDIMNRWIYPLERRADFLTLPTGKKFSVPFDCLFMISTNIPPKELVDAAMLRRIPYKFYVGAPTLDELESIFESVSRTHGIPYDSQWVDLLIQEYYTKYDVPFARFNVNYLFDQMAARCKYLNIPFEITRESLLDAAQHMIVKE
jgi:hypothetical protein